MNIFPGNDGCYNRRANGSSTNSNTHISKGQNHLCRTISEYPASPIVVRAGDTVSVTESDPLRDAEREYHALDM